MNTQTDIQARRMAANVLFKTGYYRRAKEIFRQIGMYEAFVSCQFILNEERIKNEISKSNVLLRDQGIASNMSEYDYECALTNAINRILFTSNLN